MRTTLTLDADLAAKLRALARERGVPFKEALNSVLRLGLAGGTGSPRAYRLPARPMHLRRGLDLDKALGMAAELEDSETIRKLELRK